MRVSSTTLKLLAATPPKLTRVVLSSPLPRSVTGVPPVVGPVVGLALASAGAEAYRKNPWAVPRPVVTSTPADCNGAGGGMAVTCVALSTVKERAD